MNISMNELKATLKRCFEASGYFVGNYEDAANMVLWLEKHGLNGLNELKQALPYIGDDFDKPLSNVIYEDSTSAIIDAHHRSALNCIAAAVDLAHAKALESGIATVTVHNCHNRMFILKALTDRGRAGISAAAYWKNGSTKVSEHTAAIRSGQRYPSYSEAVANLSNNDDDKQALTIICSSRVDLTSSLQNTNSTFISPKQVEKNKQHTVEYGVEIEEDVWAEINRIGAGVLVENTERSQQDAGGR
ncbi:DUF3726 domain-containing protein [Thalassotalea sp. ND16A]|uniref:DUF3726 domain-containing protein n=1 Tax=Thalassotalea sp. ND16A TaxID=1535422 RepID=UPI000519F997|nr:DUF3726 domain-containing protein [Thalassotalea sp. ND16A]KGJ89317.1 hypothetical protein ND16A_2210 [Thalassotalea sp. ND16A]